MLPDSFCCTSLPVLLFYLGELLISILKIQWRLFIFLSLALTLYSVLPERGQICASNWDHFSPHLFVSPSPSAGCEVFWRHAQNWGALYETLVESISMRDDQAQRPTFQMTKPRPKGVPSLSCLGVDLYLEPTSSESVTTQTSKAGHLAVIWVLFLHSWQCSGWSAGVG